MIVFMLACGRPDFVQEDYTGPMSQAPAGFWDHWGDGSSEVSGYRLQIPRYGELREGEAVMVFVTETFDGRQMVKSDGGHTDEFPVLKLNLVQDFGTGIYDYNVLTSAFVRLDGAQPLGTPVKVSQSVQEWCGHTWDQLNTEEKRLSHIRHSYFDGEADGVRVRRMQNGGVFGDVVPILARGLAGKRVDNGSVEVPFLPTLLDLRFAHEVPEWTTASLKRDEAVVEVDVPAGRFSATRFTVTSKQTTTWWIEAAAPHRIVKWERSDGYRGELTGSLRTKYWEQTANADAGLRARLGLAPADEGEQAE